MYEALLLPGQPEITPANVKLWSQIQRANWVECLRATKTGAHFFKELSKPKLYELILLGEKPLGTYSVSYASDGNPAVEQQLGISRRMPAGEDAHIAYVSYPWFGKQDFFIKAEHSHLGTHEDNTIAIAIGLLEYIGYQQGPAAYEIALRRLQAQS